MFALNVISKSIVIFSFVLFLFSPFRVQAFGVTPSYIEIPDIYKGEKIVQTVNITSQKSEQDIISSYSVSVVGDGAEFVTMATSTVLPFAKNGVLVFSFTIDSSRADLKTYEPKIVVKPNFIDSGGVVSVNLSLPVRMSFTVTNEKKSLLEVRNGDIKILNDEQVLELGVMNNGNTSVGIKKIFLTFSPFTNSGDKAFSFDVPVNTPSTTPPGTLEKYYFPLTHEISAGNYTVHASVEDSSGKYHEVDFIYSLNGVMSDTMRAKKIIYIIAGLITFGAILLTYFLYRKKI